MTLIPLRMYLKNGKVKLELAVAEGKKLYDKRDSKKKADVKREMDRRFRGINDTDFVSNGKLKYLQ